MKFVSALGFSEIDESAMFRFERHEKHEACIGDQIWSDGKIVHIYDYASTDVIYEFAEEVENKKCFLGACRVAGII